MSEHVNQGWYGNLWVFLTGPDIGLHLEVRLVARFFFRPDTSRQPPDPLAPGQQPWPPGEQNEWKRRFKRLIDTRWSSCHRLYADVSRDPIDPLRERCGVMPVADVAVRVIDADSPPEGMEIPSRQRINEVHVWRVPPDGSRGIQHASATSREAVLYQDALEPRDATGMGDIQTAALHEVGHLFGLVHAGCWSHQLDSDQDVNVMNQTECYGDSGPERLSVMGGGDEIRAQDYVVFAYIMQRLRPEWLWSAASHPAEAPGARRLARSRGVQAPACAREWWEFGFP